MIVKINKIKIGYNYPPVLIAEISGNHNGSKKRFLQLVRSACKNGADLIIKIVSVDSYRVDPTELI